MTQGFSKASSRPSAACSRGHERRERQPDPDASTGPATPTARTHGSAAARRRRLARRTGTAPVADRADERSPGLAVVVLIAMAVVIALAGVAANDGGLQGSQSDTGTFKLLPITTTTTS